MSGPATSDSRLRTADLTTPDPRPPTPDLRLTTYDSRPTTHDPRPTTPDPRPPTPDPRPPTYDPRSEHHPCLTKERAAPCRASGVQSADRGCDRFAFAWSVGRGLPVRGRTGMGLHGCRIPGETERSRDEVRSGWLSLGRSAPGCAGDQPRDRDRALGVVSALGAGHVAAAGRDRGTLDPGPRPDGVRRTSRPTD